MSIKKELVWESFSSSPNCFWVSAKKKTDPVQSQVVMIASTLSWIKQTPDLIMSLSSADGSYCKVRLADYSFFGVQS